MGYAQSVQVRIAGSDYVVSFADTGLSVTNQQRIAADLTTAFSLTISSGKIKSMLFTDESESVVIVDENNQKSMQIAKPLSDKYLKAFAWMDANTNAVQKAYKFVALLNSPDLLSKPAQMLLNLGHFDPLSGIKENDPPSDTEIRAVIAQDVFPYKYPGICALRFYFAPIPGNDDAGIPMIFLFVVDKTDPTKIDAVPIGFYKGKWGFGNFSLE
jgi:hypothetical protein